MIRRLLALFFALILSCPLSYAKILDKVLAVVNDEVITQSEIERFIYPLYLQYRDIYKTEEELYKKLEEDRKDILKQLITDKLILSEARRLNMTVAEKEIEERIESVKKELLEKGIALHKLLLDQNLTLNELRNKYKEQIMIQKAVDQEVRAKIDIQPSEVSNYYLTHIDDYSQSEQVAVYTILIKKKKERTTLESYRLASDVYKMLLDGGDFKTIARNYSEGPNREEGGDLGYVEKGQLLKEIDDVIFFLKTGQISDLIETPVGYHIFKVYDRKEERRLPFDEVRPRVTDALYRQKMQAAFEEWLEKLRSNAYISIK